MGSVLSRPSSNRSTAEKTIVEGGLVGGFKRLSEEETKEKIRESFRCEKFGPNHICKRKQLRVMLLEEEEEEMRIEVMRNSRYIWKKLCLSNLYPSIASWDSSFGVIEEGLPSPKYTQERTG